MKNLIVAACAAALLAACGTTQYIISTNTGQMVTAYGKPDVDKDKGTLTYEDQDGKKVVMKLSDVKQVMER